MSLYPRNYRSKYPLDGYCRKENGDLLESRWVWDGSITPRISRKLEREEYPNRPEPNILLFRRPLGTDGQTGKVDPELADRQRKQFLKQYGLEWVFIAFLRCLSETLFSFDSLRPEVSWKNMKLRGIPWQTRVLAQSFIRMDGLDIDDDSETVGSVNCVLL